LVHVAGIDGKKPAEIAVAASAEVLQAYEKVRRGVDMAYPDNVQFLNKKN
jgi:xanthine/CO dehydrogenase XdhC/CoxF family maturation factor